MTFHPEAPCSKDGILSVSFDNIPLASFSSNSLWLPRHAAQLSRLRQEVDELRRLVGTYEDSIQHKDGVITNLTTTIQKMVRYQNVRF